EHRPKSKPMFTEEDPADTAYLGDTCQQWEAAIQPVTAMGKRLVVFRTGIVLSTEGGALPGFRKPARMGFAAVLGNGRQMISWIHLEDIARLYLYAIENEHLQGVYNAVSPQPVSNEHLVTCVTRTLKGNFFISVNVPSFLLKIMLGEM